MTTPMVPRFDDCIDEEMVDKLIELMSDKFINDHGTMLVQLASFDFYFTAKIAATLAILTTDTINKVIAMSALLPRVIDPVNLTADCYDWMSDTEMATLVRATPGSACRFVRSDLGLSAGEPLARPLQLHPDQSHQPLQAGARAHRPQAHPHAARLRLRRGEVLPGEVQPGGHLAEG